MVFGSLLRATQHMVTAADYLAWRPLLQPVLERSRRTFDRATAGVNPVELAATARRLLAERPLTRPALGRLLAERWPAAEPGGAGLVGPVPLPSGPPAAQRHLGGPRPDPVRPGRVLARPPPGDPVLAAGPDRAALAAFGPALVNDIQAWSGLTCLRDPVERLGGDLRRFRDEHGRLLYDLPDALRPAPDTPAPPRFLAPFDNLLLAHADRTRIITDDHRRRVCIGAVVEPTVLLDGQVAAIWRRTQNPTRATLTIEPLTGLSRTDRPAVTVEGERLLAFAAAPTDHDIRFTTPER